MSHVVDAARRLITSLKLWHTAFSHGDLLGFLPVLQQGSKRNVPRGREERLLTLWGLD